jgi:hypothetical protein
MIFGRGAGPEALRRMVRPTEAGRMDDSYDLMPNVVITAVSINDANDAGRAAVFSARSSCSGVVLRVGVHRSRSLDRHGGRSIRPQRAHCSQGAMPLSKTRRFHASPPRQSRCAFAAIVFADPPRTVSHDRLAHRIRALNLPLCTAQKSPVRVGGVTDGQGGAIFVWIDGRDGATLRPYAQHVSAAGDVQWTTDGVRSPRTT